LWVAAAQMYFKTLLQPTALVPFPVGTPLALPG